MLQSSINNSISLSITHIIRIIITISICPHFRNIIKLGKTIVRILDIRNTNYLVNKQNETM